jgi:hypothetical protein
MGTRRIYTCDEENNHCYNTNTCQQASNIPCKTVTRDLPSKEGVFPVLATPWLAGGVGRLDQPNFSLAVFALRAALGQITAAMNGSAALCGLPALPPSCCGWHDRSVRRELRGFCLSVTLVNGCGPSPCSRCWRLLRCWPGLKVEAIPQRLL